VKTARFVRWHHSLPTCRSEIALSARMSAPSFAGSPRCTFILTKKVAVPAAILFRSISMAAARISASGAPTSVVLPPSPIYLLTAFNNDWLSHKYSNGSSISVLPFNRTGHSSFPPDTPTAFLNAAFCLSARLPHGNLSEPSTVSGAGHSTTAATLNLTGAQP